MKTTRSSLNVLDGEERLSCHLWTHGGCLEKLTFAGSKCKGGGGAELMAHTHWKRTSDYWNLCFRFVCNMAKKGEGSVCLLDRMDLMCWDYSALSAVPEAVRSFLLGAMLCNSWPLEDHTLWDTCMTSAWLQASAHSKMTSSRGDLLSMEWQHLPLAWPTPFPPVFSRPFPAVGILCNSMFVLLWTTTAFRFISCKEQLFLLSPQGLQ